MQLQLVPMPYMPYPGSSGWSTDSPSCFLCGEAAPSTWAGDGAGAGPPAEDAPPQAPRPAASANTPARKEARAGQAKYTRMGTTDGASGSQPTADPIGCPVLAVGAQAYLRDAVSKQLAQVARDVRGVVIFQRRWRARSTSLPLAQLWVLVLWSADDDQLVDRQLSNTVTGTGVPSLSGFRADEAGTRLAL